MRVIKVAIADDHKIFRKGVILSLRPFTNIKFVQEDRKNQEENSLAFYGYNAAGIKQAIAVAKQNFSALKKLNPVLCEFFENALDRKIQTPYFQHILNN